MIYHYISGERRNSYLIKYSDNIMLNYGLHDKNLMRNIKKSVPSRNRDKALWTEMTSTKVKFLTWCQVLT